MARKKKRTEEDLVRSIKQCDEYIRSSWSDAFPEVGSPCQANLVVIESNAKVMAERCWELFNLRRKNKKTRTLTEGE
jgi:hypothetical protein